jgi:hypothetical protein
MNEAPAIEVRIVQNLELQTRGTSKARAKAAGRNDCAYRDAAMRWVCELFCSDLFFRGDEMKRRWN